MFPRATASKGGNRMKGIVCLLGIVLAGSVRADLNSEIRAHEDAFARACEAGNVDAVLALYTDDAIVVWPGAGEEGKGKAAIEELATGFCKGARNLKLTLKSLDVIGLDDTHAATVGHWEGASTGPGGKRMTGATAITGTTRAWRPWPTISAERLSRRGGRRIRIFFSERRRAATIRS